MSTNITLSYVPDALDTSKNTPTWDDTYKWLLAWFIAIILLTLVNKTRIGHVFIYYWLGLLILFLLVTQYKFIVAALGPISQPIPTGAK